MPTITPARVLCLFLLLATAVAEQQLCAPPVLTRSTQPNLLSGTLEADFGELIAQRIATHMRVVDDDAITAHLRDIGERLARKMPTEGIHFHFLIVDSPSANAFALPGGRIYVTRKLIAMARSEDELAGVLAHEMGHQLAHHSAIEFTRMFQNVLQITVLKDSADLEEKFNELLDNYRRNPKTLSQSTSHPQEEQLGADQVGLYAVAGAGYAPGAFVDVLDRLMETKGRTGNWLSDLFGMTSPESRRLRELVKNLSTLSATCIDSSARATADDFRQWQASVRIYSGAGNREDLHGVINKRSLTPAAASYCSVSPSHCR